MDPLRSIQNDLIHLLFLICWQITPSELSNFGRSTPEVNADWQRFFFPV
jgi:hypothetical protein